MQLSELWRIFQIQWERLKRSRRAFFSDRRFYSGPQMRRFTKGRKRRIEKSQNQKRSNIYEMDWEGNTSYTILLKRFYMIKFNSLRITGCGKHKANKNYIDFLYDFVFRFHPFLNPFQNKRKHLYSVAPFEYLKTCHLLPFLIFLSIK